MFYKHNLLSWISMVLIIVVYVEIETDNLAEKAVDLLRVISEFYLS